MAELVLETPEGLRLRHDLAGAGSRAGAALLDGALLVVTFLAALLLVAVFAQLDGETLSSVLGALLLGGVLVATVALQALVPSLLDGRTPGKLLFGLRVVDRRGWPASPRQHLLRALFWPLEAFLTVPLPVGLVAMAVLPDHQRLGDLVAGTVVLHEERGSRGARTEEPFARERWDALPSRRLDLTPAQKERFGGADLAFLRELFARTGIQLDLRRRLFRDAWVHYARVLGRDVAAAERATAEEAAASLRELYLFLWA